MVVVDNVKLTDKQKQAGRILANKIKKFFLFYGSSRSGKTFLICYFIRHRARKYAGSKHLVARYSFANAKKTVWLQTLYPLLREDENKGLCKIDQTSGICRYKNGSVIILGGLEPSRIDSILAAEYATIFVTEANENKFENIEDLFSRLNDTAKDSDGNMIPLRFIMDLNPTVKTHWTNILFNLGLDPISGEPRENFEEFESIHFAVEDNKENLSPGYIKSLKALSPTKRKRFYDGKYGSFEGLVYNIDESVHVVDDFEIPSDWQKGRAIDFGYTHPFVCLWIAYDKSNEILYVYRELKTVKTTVKKNAKLIHEMTGHRFKEQIQNGSVVPRLNVHKEGCPADTDDDMDCTCKYEKISWNVCDWDAEDRATLEENLIKTIKADKQVLAGIDRIEELLETDPAEGKRTNIKIFRSCKETINGFYAYRWKDATRYNTNPKDREVVKEEDDEMDALRYGVMKVFPPGGRKVPGFILKRKELSPGELIDKSNQKRPATKRKKKKLPKLPGALLPS